MRYLKESNLDFPGSLVVRIPGFHCSGMGLIPGWGISRKPRVVAKKKKKKGDGDLKPGANCGGVSGWLGTFIG